MSIVTINNEHLTDIADAIRRKRGLTDKYKTNEMANAIDEIEVTEDLTNEFNNYETYLTNQETTIDDIFTALEGKVVNGTAEIWTFTMEDDSIVTKEVIVR